MGIILITVMILIISIASMHIFWRNDLISDFLGPIVSATSGILLVLILVAIVVEYASINATIASNNEVYKSLSYQVETAMYNNDNEVGKKELADQITDWNSDLAKNRANHKNFWINVFYPIDYEQFDYIPIEMIK